MAVKAGPDADRLQDPHRLVVEVHRTRQGVHLRPPLEHDRRHPVHGQREGGRDARRTGPHDDHRTGRHRSIFAQRARAAATVTTRTRGVPMRIALFITCLADTLFPAVPRATVTLLERLGHEVVVPGGQTCCGRCT
jgi:Fe-S oxidoreductase